MSSQSSASPRAGEHAARLRLLADECGLAAQKMRDACPLTAPQRRRRLREIYPWVSEAGRTVMVAWRDGALPPDGGIVAGLAHVHDERAKAYHALLRGAQRWLPQRCGFQWDQSRPWAELCCDAMRAFAKLFETGDAD